MNFFRHFGPHCIDLEAVRGGFVVAGLQKQHRDTQAHQSEFIRLGRRAPLVVMDEAHSAIAPTYQHLLSLLTITRGMGTAILGLSATPGRAGLVLEDSQKLAKFFARFKVALQIPGYADPVYYLQ